MDWLAKLVALSYLLSRYLSLTTLKLPKNYYWYNSKFQRKLSTVNISVQWHSTQVPWNISKVFTVNISVSSETGTTGGPMTEFLGQVSHSRKICYWTNKFPHFCSSHISEHLKCEFICSILGSDQPSLDNVQQRAKAVSGQHWPSCINIWPKPHSHPGIIMSKNFRLEHSWMLEEHQPSSTHFWSKFTTIQVLIIVQS